jgi:hypothetical protein
MRGRPKKWVIDPIDAQNISDLKAERRRIVKEIRRLRFERDSLTDALIAEKFELPTWVVQKHD